MTTKGSSTDKQMPLPSDEVREKLLNPDFLNPSSLPDTTKDDDKPLNNHYAEDTVMTQKSPDSVEKDSVESTDRGIVKPLV